MVSTTYVHVRTTESTVSHPPTVRYRRDWTGKNSTVVSKKRHSVGRENKIGVICHLQDYKLVAKVIKYSE